MSLDHKEYCNIDNLNITDLPKDVLQNIKSFLGKQKNLFLYAILPCKNSDEFSKLLEMGSPILDSEGRRKNWDIVNASPLLNIIHNSMTYVQMFEEVLWGQATIPDNKDFKEILIPDGNLSKAQIIKNKFEIIDDISEYLSTSPNKSSTDIIWKGKIIGTKKKYTKYFMATNFWNKPFHELKNGSARYYICGCTPFCWRCKEECNIFNVKHGDKLVVKSHENKIHYVCEVKIVKFENKHYTSVRDIYRECFQDKKGWENIWETELCPKIEVFVELLPLPHQPVLNKTFQFVNGSTKFYYMAYCYTSMLDWDRTDEHEYHNIRRMIIDDVHNLPYGWILCAKQHAKTALALIY